MLGAERGEACPPSTAWCRSARSSADSADSPAGRPASGPASALGGVGGDDAGGERARAGPAPASGRTAGRCRRVPRARRRSPTSPRRRRARAAARRGASPSAPNTSRRLVEVVGQQEAAHRADLQRGVDLVDPGLGAVAATGVAASTSRNCQRAGRSSRGGRPSAPGSSSTAYRSGTRTPSTGTSSSAPERVDEPGAHQAQPPGQQHGGRARRRRSRHPGRRRRRAHAARRPRRRSRAAGRATRSSAAVTRSTCCTASARSRSACSVLSSISPLPAVSRASSRGQVVEHGRAQRDGGPGGEQRPAGDGARGPAGRAAPGEVDRPQRPPGDVVRVEAGHLDLPLQPQRHPRLRPAGHGDQVGVDPAQDREPRQLVGDGAARARRHRRAGRPRGPPARRPRGAGTAGDVDGEHLGGAVVACRRPRTAAPTRRAAG